MIKFRQDCDYALLVPTSMGVRLTPADGQGFHCSKTFTMEVTSAESNVASVSAYLGLPVKEVAAVVDAPVETVRTRLKRALTALRTALEADARTPKAGIHNEVVA